MEIAKTIESVRSFVGAARKDGKRVGFVPTMGALHEGHLSLIRQAVKRCDFVVVSIFVNPTQFAPGDDYGQYPRALEADAKLCREAGVDVVFAPSAEEIYPRENLTWVNVEKITEGLCGESRPGHFRGVTTVCSKLFNIVNPDMAFFGQKDAQQAVVIRRMVADLNMRLEIVVYPTIRLASGLAVSSRNKYLSEKEKDHAAAIYKSLTEAKAMIDSGVLDTETISQRMRNTLDAVESIKIEYISISDVETLESVERVDRSVLIAIAVKIGTTRLIDNIRVDFCL